MTAVHAAPPAVHHPRMTSENRTSSIDAVRELNESDPCRECADLGSLAGSGMFCWVCGQGDRNV